VIARTDDVPTPSPIALLALAILQLGWFISWRAESAMGQQILLTPILAVSVFAALGPRVARPLMPPLMALWFAIPVWDLLLPVLQSMSVYVSSALLRVLGVPVVIHGAHVSIPDGQFDILYGCSGKRDLAAATALAYLMVFRLE